MKIIGLDISTACLGWSLLEFKKKPKLSAVGYYKPSEILKDDENLLNSFSWLTETKKFVIDLIKKHQPNRVAIEDFIRFLRGGSGSSTILPLAILNRTICLAIKEEFPDLPLDICNVISIRTNLKKQFNLSELPEKKSLPDLFEKHLKIKIPKLMNKKGNKILDEVFDEADSIAVAIYSNSLLNK